MLQTSGTKLEREGAIMGTGRAAMPKEIALVVVLDGHLYADAVERLEGMIAAADGAWIALDLSRVEHADAGGLGALVRLHRRLAETRGGIVLLRPGARLAELLRITRLAEVFPIRATAEGVCARSTWLRAA